MANTQVLQRDFSGGFAQDYPRDQMPPGKVWYAENSISSADGVSIERRGGTTYFSGTLANIGTWEAAEQPDGFSWTDVLVGVASVSSSGRILTVNSSGTVTNRAAIPAGGAAPSLRICNFNGKVISSAGGTSAKPFSVTAAYAVATLTNGPANCTELCSHKDRLVVVQNTVGTSYRLYFSSPLDETTWDLTYGWIGFQDYIGAARSVNGMLVVWTPSHLYRVRGSTPPPARDMIVEPIMRNPGVIYPEQVAIKEQLAFWANDAGVYATDGTSTIDLTEKCGIKDWWIQARVDQVQAGGSNISVGCYQNFVIAGHVMSNAVGGKFVAIDYRKYQAHVWVLPTGYTFPQFVNGASSFYAGEETYALLNSSTHRWENLSDCFNPESANKADANGTTHTFRVETPFYGLGHPGLKRLKNMYVAHDLRDAASDNPTLTPSYITSPENTSYTDLTVLSETTAYNRERRSLNKLAHGVAFKFTGTNPASASKLYSIELESHNLEHSRRAQ